MLPHRRPFKEHPEKSHFTQGNVGLQGHTFLVDIQYNIMFA